MDGSRDIRWSAETTGREFKVSVEHARPKSWLKSVSAFANTLGGVVVFGIDDASHQIVGIEDAQAEVAFISRAIRDRIDPLPRFEVEMREEAGRPTIALHVHADSHPPYYYCGDGRREAYVRNGDRSELADAERLNELILKGTNRTWDSLDSGIARDRASFTVLKATYAPFVRDMICRKATLSRLAW